MKKNVKQGNKKRMMTKVILFTLTLTLIFTLGITTSLAAIPNTSIHLFTVPGGTISVSMDYGSGPPVVMTQQGGFWKTPDGGEYYTDDIHGFWIDAGYHPITEFNVGTEGGGTLNIWFIGAAPIYYNVYYDGNGNDGGTVPTDATNYLNGDNVTVESGVPTKTGFLFMGWESAQVVGTFWAGNNFTMPAMDVYLVAQWEEQTEPEGDFAILTSVVNGTIDPDEYGIPAGEDRTISYSPNSGFHLVSVTVDYLSVDIGTYPSSYSFLNIESDHTVDVVYAADTEPEADFSIVTSVVNGTIDPTETGISAGSDRTINYSPDTGFHLVSVKVDDSPVDITMYPSSYDFLDIDSDHTIDVVYGEDVVTDTISNTLLIIGGALLIAGVTTMVIARKRKATE